LLTPGGIDFFLLAGLRRQGQRGGTVCLQRWWATPCLPWSASPEKTIWTQEDAIAGPKIAEIRRLNNTSNLFLQSVQLIDPIAATCD
jgi:hypothetical protein